MNLVNIIENNLENKEFWLPINEVSRQHFFDDEWTEFYGVFVGNDLIAAAALFYNEHEYNESLLAINRRISNVAEIGRAMVHPDYRGKNILLEINMKLIEVAQKKNIEYLIATIHPDNVASQKSFLKRLIYLNRCLYFLYLIYIN